MASAFLAIVAGDEGAHHALPHDRETLIGRGGECDIVIPKRSVSRQHARISHADGHFYIQDLRSINGTFVNGNQITAATRLDGGDRIHIYGVTLQFEVGDVPPPALAEPPAQREQIPTVVSVASPDIERYSLALEISQQLGSSLDIDAILPKVIDKLFTMFPYASDGEILLLNDDGELSPRAMKHGRDADSSILTRKPISGKLAGQVLETGTPFLETDCGLDQASVFQEGLQSRMCVPVNGPTDGPLGVIHLESDDPEQQFTEEDMELVVVVATVAAQAVEYATSHAERLETRRRRDQLQVARDVQARMLPRSRPEVPGYSLFEYYRAADQIGGDYYGYFHLPGERVAVAVGDVCGKGLPAALTMAELSSEVRRCLETVSTMKRAMDHLGRHFDRPQTFITFSLSILDPQNHTLAIVTAGHIPPLRKSGASGVVEPTLLEKGGLPLGTMSKEVYHPMVFDVEPGDQFLFYTDGVSEALGPQKELFGTDRLIESMQRASQSAEESVAAVVSDLASFCAGTSQADDICLVGIGRDPVT